PGHAPVAGVRAAAARRAQGPAAALTTSPARRAASSLAAWRDLHRPFETILTGVIHVSGELACSRLPESHAEIETVRVLESRLRPQDHARDGVASPPVEHGRRQRLADSATAQVAVQVESMQLGRRGVEPLDAGGSDHDRSATHDEEGAPGRLVVAAEVEEVGDLADWLVDEAVLRVHAAHQGDDTGSVRSRGARHGGQGLQRLDATAHVADATRSDA